LAVLSAPQQRLRLLLLLLTIVICRRTDGANVEKDLTHSDLAAERKLDSIDLRICVRTLAERRAR
jgi:hypothetical protein